MTKLVCYCFGYTEEDIREDIATKGRSTILDNIREAKKFGNCQCAVQNPKGR